MKEEASLFRSGSLGPSLAEQRRLRPVVVEVEVDFEVPLATTAAVAAFLVKVAETQASTRLEIFMGS